MVVLMTGLPPPLLYSLYALLFPVRFVRGPDYVHHIFLLCLMAWLITVGPKRDILGSLGLSYDSIIKILK